MRVVIVDDDRLVAVSLKTILESDAAITVAALGYSGEDAVILYEREQPDILLMDIRMNGISGLEAAERILFSDPEAKILFRRCIYYQSASDRGKGLYFKAGFRGDRAGSDSSSGRTECFWRRHCGKNSVPDAYEAAVGLCGIQNQRKRAGDH